MERGKKASHTSENARLIGGRYALECALGAGGMGTVWRALDLRTQRDVALKQLHEVGVDAHGQLTREIRALAQLRHPNLVHVLDAGITEQGTPYLVMELVPGTTLRQELNGSGRMPVERACSIAAQIARALVAAHAEGVVHRDLKPSNIMLSDLYGEHDFVKLVDFGLAQVAGNTQVSLSGAAFVGTPEYASPEQAKGEPTTPRSDLYALGVIIYEMLAGRLPFEAETPMGMLFQHAHTLPQPPSRLERAVPAWLDELILCLLQKEPSRRTDTAQEVLERLRAPRALAGSVERVELAHAATIRAQLPRAEPAAPLDNFVGRQPELERLRRRLASAVEGSGGVVFISGDAGVGKTLLGQQMLSRAQADGHALLIATGRCLDHAVASEPYLPFLQAVGEWLMGDDAEQARALLRRHAPLWCLQFPRLFGADAVEQLRRETAGATRERMLRELGDVLSAAAERRCVLLLLEDLHWADPSSVDQLRLLCQRSPGQRWLVDEARQSEMLAVRGACAVALGEFERAEPALEASLELAQKLQHTRALQIAAQPRVIVHLQHAEFLQAEAACARALQLALRPGSAVMFRFNRGCALASLGRVSEGLAQIDAALELARRTSPKQFVLQTFALVVGAVHRDLGHVELATELHLSLLTELEQRADEDPPLQVARLRSWIELGLDYLSAECLEKSHAAFARATELIRGAATSRLAPVLERVELTLSLAALELASRHEPPAPLRARTQALLEQAQQLKRREDEGRMRLMLARLERDLGHLAPARQQLSLALAVLQLYPMPFLAWRVHALRAELCAAAGDSREALTAFGDSAQVIREIAQSIQDTALRQIFLESKDVRPVLRGACMTTPG